MAVRAEGSQLSWAEAIPDSLGAEQIVLSIRPARRKRLSPEGVKQYVHDLFNKPETVTRLSVTFDDNRRLDLFDDRVQSRVKYSIEEDATPDDIQSAATSAISSALLEQKDYLLAQLA